MKSAPNSVLRVERPGKTLRELTLEKMRSAIQSGHFKPGERLIERTLCEQLDVSRSIVREVLRHLETEGLVETVAHQGPVVATLTVDQILQIYEIRALLEGHAAKVFAERAEPQTLVKLEAINQRIQDAFTAADHAEVVACTSQFYQLLFEGAGHHLAWTILQSLNARINRMRLVTIATPNRQRDAAEEMNAILSALRARDPVAAQQAAEAHVRMVSSIARERMT